MFNSPNDLTPDPEWLLQSGEADPDLLAEVLTEVYYSFLFELAEILFETDPTRILPLRKRWSEQCRMRTVTRKK